jgi:hypothetical protein
MFRLIRVDHTNCLLRDKWLSKLIHSMFGADDNCLGYHTGSDRSLSVEEG